MSLFPPSWRADDWYVATWLQELENFNPKGMMIAGAILGGIFGLLGLCFSVAVYKAKKAAGSSASA